MAKKFKQFISNLGNISSSVEKDEDIVDDIVATSVLSSADMQLADKIINNMETKNESNT